MNLKELKTFLDSKAEIYNQPKFIGTDPIQMPRKFALKEDIEISGFLIATIAWGNRKSIINNGEKLLSIMGNSPFDFVMNYKLKSPKYEFVHRTFNSTDLHYFFQALQHIYQNHGGLEAVFERHQDEQFLMPAIYKLKQLFFELPHETRTEKHISNPLKNSACKRINMFLRWMVRKDHNGVDFGIWEKLSPAKLSCPLDVHSGKIARELKLLNRKQNDAKAVLELDKKLRKLDPIDPVKYDFALFGLNAFEDF
ncbi:TIGR02757 family protein [Psychroflexus planctonicus]|uniref:TIGR02757 family protein n=1 Tax=Psychroflexus planctonicus TaxID=1526575 RepID=A0ABQ1SK04_9FLAO|nr:TIGR02757 family protein [Psychroflexus planctonicus]GGE42466.1 TIGR02757 family protein [Psychroflexus planctonicus]